MTGNGSIQTGSIWQSDLDIDLEMRFLQQKSGNKQYLILIPIIPVVFIFLFFVTFSSTDTHLQGTANVHVTCASM